ncbi:Signal transduction histidine kinase containing PAS domain [Methanonatronarchaeum thermophilum]|uniref:Signal transduction histidine kinase containing PAS domain n=1 Tax=Methanonatronarchaeum thermophilum TaxID=1927129 RepID=A0A1Y3GFH8_9EURY|nr:PAS domain-containing sensor histidine kinase [Methanonatronarchaeum thermophilum]OUJ18136.1 Signal transduction histidine kinase containing PAS domain [Methanonatronarchaeum thermophilum]
MSFVLGGVSIKERWASGSLEFVEHPDPMAYLDQDFSVSMPNNAFLDLVGVESIEDLGDSDFDLFFDKKEVHRKLVKSGGYPVEHVTTIRTLGGGERDVSILFKPISLCDKEYIARFRDITEQRNVERREELLRSILTHDIRNHNQVVLGHLELMKEKRECGTINRIDKVIGSVENSLKTIDKIQKLAARLERSKIQRKSYSVVENYLIDAVDEHKKQLDHNDIRLKFKSDNGRDIDMDRACIKVDHFIVDVISNLIENSIDHADCSIIRLETSIKQSYLEITVEDDGKGIKCENPEIVFDVEYTERTTSGGIGLHLVKKIIESYEGSIELNTSELGGAKFTIQLNRCKRLDKLT